MLLTASLALLFYGTAYLLRVAPFQELVGVRGRIYGQILEEPEVENQKFSYPVRVERVRVNGEQEESELSGFQVLLVSRMPLVCEPQDYLECEVSFLSFPEDEIFSLKNYYLARNAVLKANPTDYGGCTVIPAGSRTPAYFFQKLNRALCRTAKETLSEDSAALVEAMVLGSRNDISDGMAADFRQIGASHLLVISGLHMAVVAALLSALFGALRLPKRLRYLLTAICILLFLTLIGFPYSALRSGVMFLLYLGAQMLGREPDSFNSLGAAVLCICLWNPFAAGDIGLMLSFLSTLGILLCARRLENWLASPLSRLSCGWLQKLLRMVCASLAVSGSAILFTLPVQIGVFGGVSLLGALAGLLLIPLGTALIFLAFPALACSLLPALQPLAQPLFFTVDCLARAILTLGHGMAQLPCAYLNLDPTAGRIFLAALFAVGGLLFLRPPGRRGKTAAALVLSVVFAASVGVSYPDAGGAVTLSVADNGGSSCVVLSKGRKGAVLSCGGYNTNAAAILLERRHVNRVTALYLPSDDADSGEAAERVLQVFQVDSVLAEERLHLGKNIKKSMGTAQISSFWKDTEFQALPGVPVRTEDRGRTLCFTLFGRDVRVETGQAAAGDCDVLLTVDPENGTNSPFTVLQTDDIIIPEREGTYLSVPANGGTALVFYPDGTMRIRRES